MTGPLRAMLALAVLTAGSCQGTPSPLDAAADGAFPQAATWPAIMKKVIGPAFEEHIQDEIAKDDDRVDFRAVARAATVAADHMALGYGVHEKKDVAGFADMARSAEAWLRTIRARAAEHDLAAVRGLVETGVVQHCDRCHDAAR